MRRIVCIALLLAPIAALPAGEVPQPSRPTVFAAYYVWYHTGEHPQKPWLHWTYPASETNALAKKAQRFGEPSPASAARPLAGYYDSADPLIAGWHVQLAKAAGIDAFLVSWWDMVNELDQSFERGILAAAEKNGFKIALLDERAQYHDRLEDYQAMLTRALRKYKDSPAYLRLDGKPAVYLYQVAQKPGLTPADFTALKKHVESELGPVYWIVDKIAHDHQAARAGEEDRIKCIPREWLSTPGMDAFGFYSAFSHFRAHEYHDLAGKYRYLVRLAREAGKKMLLPVHPGHDNSHFRDDPYVMPRRDGQTLRDYLRAATDAGADYILVTSWNEWPETTVVEPSSSWPDPYLYLKILAEWKGVAFTAPPLPVSHSGTSLLPPNLQGLKLGGKNAADARVNSVRVSGQPFPEALQVETLKRPPYPWNITLATLTTGAMRKGDVLLATVTARRIKSRQETGEALIEVIVEENDPEHHKLLELATSVGPEWTVIRAPFVADKDYAASAAQLSMRFGYPPQITQVAAVGLTNYGTQVALRDLPSTWARYAGWETNAPWRQAAAERIEKIRKGDLRVEVVDANGKPVPGAQVSARMLRHEFAFGSAIDSRRIVVVNDPDNQRYRQTIEKYFNKVVFANDLKWPRWDTNRTDWQQHRTNVLAAIEWLRARNIAVRGHVMIWPSWENTPGWLRQFESQPGKLRAAIDAHFADQTATLKGKLAEWDVINESYAHNDVVKVLGREEMVRWFKLAHQGDSSVKLFYNDYILFAGSGEGSPSQYFFDTIQFFRQQGAPIGGIGEQGHFGGSPPSPEKVLATFDRFGTLGVPIQVSEFDIDTSDEELKLHYTRDFMTACFSHPAVNGVMMWGFWEGAHWRPRAALWNKDWTIRPHGQIWLDLVTKEWWTTADGVTDSGGAFTTRGFCGDYEVTVQGDGPAEARRVTLAREGVTIRVVRKMPDARARFRQ